MYEKVLKSIVYLWVFVFLMFGVKLMINNSDSLRELPQNAWEKVSSYILELTTKDRVTLSFIEQYGITIEGVSLCQDKQKKSKLGVVTNPSISSISSACWNGDCKISMAFKNKIPKKIKLNVKLPYSANCLTETYDTTGSAQVIGYQVKLTMTDALKEKLELQTGNEEIHFKHEAGYTKTKVNENNEMTFDFNELLTSDMLMVDGKEKLEVNFELK